jgi:H+/Cl- antiporter ClcA
VRGRRTTRTALIVAFAAAAGAIAVGFAKLCDLAGAWQHQFAVAAPWAALVVLPFALAGAAWFTRVVAPQSGGSGIPQVISVAARPAPDGVADPRISWRTALLKMLVCVALLACGASIGREGPTVQICAAVVSLSAGLLRLRSTDRGALAIAGGAAGVAAAFNTPIAGIVFAVEELAKAFDRRTNILVILVVVAAGVAAYALAGDYAYFGELRSSPALYSAWFTAPIAGVAGGALGGLFARFLVRSIGPGLGRFGRFRARRPVLTAFGLGLIAAGAAWASNGATYGTGYLETRALLAGQSSFHAFSFGALKIVANLAAAMSGAPGGIFSPSLAAGAGLGAWLDTILPFGSGRDAIVLGMACYLSGVVQAPLTSAVILMEMTRNPILVGPLLLGALIARAVSSRICDQPVYHALALGIAPPIAAKDSA